MEGEDTSRASKSGYGFLSKDTSELDQGSDWKKKILVDGGVVSPILGSRQVALGDPGSHPGPILVLSPSPPQALSFS